jgi:integrase
VTSRKLELATASQAKEKQLLVQLKIYFKEQPLKAITAKRVTEYRAWRAEQKVGPATLNAELGILRRILKRAKLWARIADDIRPLKEPSSIGRAITEEEKQRLLKTAAMRPEWETAYLAAILCLNTTARGCELKGLQWCDVDLFNRTLTIRKSKTAAGERMVPLTDVAVSTGGKAAPEGRRLWIGRDFALCLCGLRSEVHLQRQASSGLQHHRLSSVAAREKLAYGVEDYNEEGGAARFPVPRSAALCHYPTCGERHV